MALYPGGNKLELYLTNLTYSTRAMIDKVLLLMNGGEYVECVG